MHTHALFLCCGATVSCWYPGAICYGHQRSGEGHKQDRVSARLIMSAADPALFRHHLLMLRKESDEKEGEVRDTVMTRHGDVQVDWKKGSGQIYNAQNSGVSSYHHKLAWHICLCLLRVSGSAFSPCHLWIQRRMPCYVLTSVSPERLYIRGPGGEVPR